MIQECTRNRSTEIYIIIQLTIMNDVMMIKLMNEGKQAESECYS